MTVVARRTETLPAPPPSRVEALTLQFYDWERRGRGWQVWDYAVELEPPYRPFFHFLGPIGPVSDDARKHTILSALVDRVRDSLVPRPRPVPPIVFEIPEPEPEADAWDSPLVEVQVSVPGDLKVTREAAEQFLLGLTYATGPVSFEVVGTPHTTLVQVACHEEDLTHLRDQLRAHFPEAVLREEQGFLRRHWEAAGAHDAVIVDFGLSREFMCPLRAFRGFEVDPLSGTVGALADLKDGELGVLQVLFLAARYPWAESIVRSVTDGDGGAFFADAPEMLSLAQGKIGRPLFASVIRIAAKSPVPGRAWGIAKTLGGSLTPLSIPSSNELIPLENDGYDQLAHEDDLLARRTHRSGMLLNSEELVSLVHLPSASVRAEKLQREELRSRAAPALATGGRLTLGENAHAGKASTVTLYPDQRIRHTYVIGASGTGKSTLLLNMILQDIQHGEGVGVLDPHGDLIEEILGRIPEERIADVVLLDPSDEKFPVGFNILQAHSELEKQLIASDLVAVFRRLSTSWGDQMTSVLGNAILAFLESEERGTLADLRRFLVEPAFRKKFLGRVTDPEVVYYWEREFPLLTGRPQAPLLTRLDTFLRPKLIRYMVAQKENRLDFAAIMDRGKIFLGKLAQGAIGEENAALLGTFLVSKFHQVTLARQEVGVEQRRNFYLYIDEFHNFATPSMAAILSGARKYHLGLVLAHQDLRQVKSRNPELLGAVLSNPYTRVCFRVGDEDARKLEEGFSHFGAEDLQNLGTGEAICRMERAEYDFNLKTALLAPVEVAGARERRERIVAFSRQWYATAREVVEVVLRREAVTAPPSEEFVPPSLRKPEVADEREPAAPQPAHTTVATPAGATVPPTERRPRPPVAPTPGRGGQQHKYLQELIKRWAESRGWKATVEKQILDGLGSVDVALEKGELSVACEISVTTSAEHELGNIQKCLAAGFGHVLVVAMDRKTLTKLGDAAAGAVREEDRARLQFVTPEEVFSSVESLEAEGSGKEETIRGRKVKTRYRGVGVHEQKAKKRVISQMILRTLRRAARDKR